MPFTLVPQSDQYLLIDICEAKDITVDILSDIWGKKSVVLCESPVATIDATVGGSFIKYRDKFNLKITLPINLYGGDKGISEEYSIEYLFGKDTLRSLIAAINHMMTKHREYRKTITPMAYEWREGLNHQMMIVCPSDDSSIAAEIVCQQYIKYSGGNMGNVSAWLTVCFPIYSNVFKDILDRYKEYCSMMAEAFYFPHTIYGTPIACAIGVNAKDPASISAFKSGGVFEIRVNHAAFDQYAYAIVVHTDTEKFTIQLTWEDLMRFKIIVAGRFVGVATTNWSCKNSLYALQKDITAMRFTNESAELIQPENDPRYIYLQIKHRDAFGSLRDIVVRIDNLIAIEICNMSIPMIHPVDYDSDEFGDSFDALVSDEHVKVSLADEKRDVNYHTSKN